MDYRYRNLLSKTFLQRACVEETLNDGIVEQASGSGWNHTSVTDHDKTFVFHGLDASHINCVSKKAQIKALTYAQTKHDDFFEVLLVGDSFASRPWHIAGVDSLAPHARMCDIPAA